MSGLAYYRSYWGVLVSLALLGISIALVQPTHFVPDEGNHWGSGHARLERMFGREGCVPTLPIHPEIRQSGHTLARYPAGDLVCEFEWKMYGDALTYPGVLLSKLILPHQAQSAVRQLQGFMLSRLLQGLMVLICLSRLGFLSRAGRRSGPLLVGAFALSPLLAQQAFGISSDGVQLCFAVCLAAAILFWERLTWLDAGLFLVMAWGAASKPFLLMVALPALLVAFLYGRVRGAEPMGLRALGQGGWQLIKPTRRPSPQNVIAWSVVVHYLAAVYFAIDFQRPGTPGVRVVGNRAGVDPGAQFRGLFEQPDSLIDLIRSLPFSPFKLADYVGLLGQLDTRMSAAVSNTYVRFVLFALLIEVALLVRSFRALPAAERAQRWRRAPWASLGIFLGGLGALGNVVFVVAVLYAMWTPVGLPIAEGVQIRYWFASNIVLLAAFAGGLDVMFGAKPEPQARDDAAIAGSRWAALLASSAPALVLALTLPYVARVFVDLVRRYG
ncbi:MAG: DUF2142 domain-containing protein [Myxococcales bacterium]